MQEAPDTRREAELPAKRLRRTENYHAWSHLGGDPAALPSTEGMHKLKIRMIAEKSAAQHRAPRFSWQTVAGSKSVGAALCPSMRTRKVTMPLACRSSNLMVMRMRIAM
jgi:hypothetical protein